MASEIIRCTQYDLMKSKAKAGQIYFVTDNRSLYKDNGNNKEQRMRLNAVILLNEAERVNHIKPVVGKFYYVEETNCLWLFDTRWVLKVGTSTEYNTYYAGDHISPVINSDTSITGLYGDKIIDNNGLLGNGAVVVRNENRTIRAVLRSDDISRNVSIQSYLDNGLLFIPDANQPYNDLSTSLGALHLTVDKKEVQYSNQLEYSGNAYYYGDWNNYGEMYLIRKNNVYVQPDYIPINEYEIIKFYVNTVKIQGFENVKQEIISTHFVIRPISDSQAIIHLLSISDENKNSVVQNDIGELIFTNRGNLIEEKIIECTRRIVKDADYYISEYILDEYDEVIRIKQNKNTVTLEAEIGETWNDNSEKIEIFANKWTKDKILTTSDIEIPETFIHRIT